MKLFITIFGFLAFSALAEDNNKIDWKTVVPRTEVPGFWAERRTLLKIFSESQKRSGRIVGG